MGALGDLVSKLNMTQFRAHTGTAAGSPSYKPRHDSSGSGGKSSPPKSSKAKYSNAFSPVSYPGGKHAASKSVRKDAGAATDEYTPKHAKLSNAEHSPKHAA